MPRVPAMNRRKFLSHAIGGTTLSLAGGPGGRALSAEATAPRPGSAVAPPSPLPRGPSGAWAIGNRAQLFLDQQVVASSRDVVFTPHAARKHPGNPLVRADRPWEGWRINVYGTVLFDAEERIFKMWYVGDTSAWFPHFATHYAVSRDGFHWEKPPVGTVQKDGLSSHNVVIDACQIASVHKDLAEPDPARRYKAVEWSHAGGARAKPIGGPHALVSPDGLRWTRISTQNLFRSNDVVTAFYDVRRKLWVALPKLSTPVRGTVRRCFGVTWTENLLDWPDPRLAFQPDLRDDAGTLARIEAVRPVLDVPDDPSLMRTEFYGVGVYQAESCVVCFPWVFSINNSARVPATRTPNHEGSCEVQLAVSRDLQTWERPFRTPVIPLGEPGAWDSGFLTTASQAFRHGDEIRLYYGGGNYTHGNPVLYDEYQGQERGTKYTSSIGLATWGLDRFVSADGGETAGSLTTVPVQASGRRLELNLEATRGEVTVELLDPAGRPLPRFGRSDPLRTDSFRATVTWHGRGDLAELSGRAIVLRFTLHRASLFSFAFRA